MPTESAEPLIRSIPRQPHCLIVFDSWVPFDLNSAGSGCLDSSLCSPIHSVVVRWARFHVIPAMYATTEMRQLTEGDEHVR